ncbi:MAG: ribose-5-phosphate isomerase RpiA [Deltaproteobacteria bacterium]|nr:ribose-5-phosphate isomerase RpiA [Deltaproteobacteria bacterium]
MAEKSLEYVREDTVVGLGTGRAATAFVRALGARVAQGFRIRGVPTSDSTGKLAMELGIPLVELADAGTLDVTLDGADEVSPELDLIKGYGGALVREKVVAASSRRRVMLVGAEKLVDRLGSRGKLPVEIVPFAKPLCERELEKIGCRPKRRETNGVPFVTDNHNWILDCEIAPIADPPAFETRILAIPGVVGTGLFLGMANVVLVQDGDRVRVLERGGSTDR